jgi:hypothetical protein
MNEGYIDDGFIGFPYFSMTLKLGTMRNSKESKKSAFDRSLGCLGPQQWSSLCL